MDRDNRWDRVELAFQALANAKGYTAETASDAIDNAYGKGRTDEFIKPRVLGDYTGMQDGDGILCLNFRADRAREILATFADPDFNAFDTGPRPDFAIVSGFTEYSRRHATYMDCIFPDERPENTLAEWVGKQGRTQYHSAETEKYPHVTFFLNGGKETPEPGEDRYLANSPKVATYDLQPEMSAPEVTDHFEAAIEKGYDLIVVNYANPDMVGHTGDLEAAKAACEAVDQGLGRGGCRTGTGGWCDDRDRRSRQLRSDDRPRYRQTAYRAHPEPGAGDPYGRPGGGPTENRAPRGPRSDASGSDGPANAA